LYDSDLEIERTFCLRKKKQRIEEQRHKARTNPTNMVAKEGDQRRTVRDFITHGVQGIASRIARPIVDANNF